MAPSDPAAAPRTDPVDELYAVPLSEFVPTRKRLSDELKGAKDAAGARAVGALTKPTLAAWITNQTVRRSPELTGRLLSATEALATAQRSIGRAGTHQQEFQAALAEQRQLLSQLGEVARGVLAEAGQPPGASVLEKVEKNLRWGPSSEEARDAFRRGRLVRDVPPPGFGALVGSGGSGAGDSAMDGPVSRAAATRSVPVPVPVSVSVSVPAGASKEARAEARRQERGRTETAARAERDRARRLAELRTQLRQAHTETERARRGLESRQRALAAALAAVQDAEKKADAARVAMAAAKQSGEAAAAALESQENAEAELRHLLAKEERES